MNDPNRFQFRVSTISLLTAVVALVFAHFLLTARHNAQIWELTQRHNAQLWEMTQRHNAQLDEMTRLHNAQLAELAARTTGGPALAREPGEEPSPAVAP